MASEWMKGLVYGLIAILLVMFASSFILSLFLKFTSTEESSIEWLVITCSVLAFFIGGITAGKKGQENGWLLGVMTALSFTVLAFLLQYLGLETIFTVKQWITHLGFVVVTIFGAIIGVNTAAKRRAS